MNKMRSAQLAHPGNWTASMPPLQRFLTACHADFASDHSGEVAHYIPELSKANPDHFGISLATLDGHVYEVGDTSEPFTIQSMSKAFVFALALDTLGAERVESVIGVEPSGDPFNSIRLNAENHPFNPMVNAGAIACSGLIREAKGDGAFEYIRWALGRFAGRELKMDDAVFASESATGDRNRAIGYLLRNSTVIKQDVGAVLEVYFRQCSVLVTARDIAIMAATLANRGINPVTGEQVMTPYAISRTLSVMTSSGMYDYAGEWIYRVGIPAKSGVGGGILAASRSARRCPPTTTCICSTAATIRAIRSSPTTISARAPRAGAAGRTSGKSSPRIITTFASSNSWARCRFPMSITSRASLPAGRARNSSSSTCAGSPH
jgi:glutaminase